MLQLKFNVAMSMMDHTQAPGAARESRVERKRVFWPRELSAPRQKFRECAMIEM